MRCRSTSLMGTTSACAENTCRNPQNAFLDWNYLRVRGEYGEEKLVFSAHLELPPRARRILGKSTTAVVAGGTTSACAENTAAGPAGRKRNRNYLRVRGEYCKVPHWRTRAVELPPRARRILHRGGFDIIPKGTTSACAENTWRQSHSEVAYRNYLRVRGEYRRKCTALSKILELPPRARRIRRHRLLP